MIRIIQSIVIGILCVISCGCKYEQAVSIDQRIANVSIMNENEAYVILPTDVFDVGSRTFTLGEPTGTGNYSGKSGHYLGKLYLNSGETEVKANLDGDWRIMHCKNNIIAITTLGGGTKFVETYENTIIKTFDVGCSALYDFTTDTNKILCGGAGIYEYNNETKTTNQVMPFPTHFRDAKYSPIDETIIAYVGLSNTANNIEGNIYTMQSDGTNIIEILSGYDAQKLCWKPEGETIVFATENKIYSINKNGSNLVLLKTFDENKVSYFYPASLYHNVFINAVSKDEIIVIKF